MHWQPCIGKGSKVHLRENEWRRQVPTRRTSTFELDQYGVHMSSAICEKKASAALDSHRSWVL